VAHAKKKSQSDNGQEGTMLERIVTKKMQILACAFSESFEELGI